MADPLLDRITDLDELVEQLLEKVTAIEKVQPDVPPGEEDIVKNHLPFYSEGPLTPGEEEVLFVRTDDEQGLGAVGRTGYISNDGSDPLEYSIYDGDGWSDWITLGAGGFQNYRKENNIWFDKVKLKSSVGTQYSCMFTR